MQSKLCSLLSYNGTFPSLHSSVFVADGARVIGDVSVGQDSSLWFNTVIRGDVHKIVIGQRTNIQDGAVLHGMFQKFDVIVGNDVSIGHLAMIHGCHIEDRCLVGMQATLLDGVNVGEESIIGAGAVVPQGMQIPPRSLVFGVPGKIVRKVTDAELEGFLKTSARYLEYCKGYNFESKM